MWRHFKDRRARRPERPADPPDDPAEDREVDRQVIQLFALVEEAIAGATDALLSGNKEAARELVAKDRLTDELYRQLQETVQRRVIKGGASEELTRWLLSLLALLPELERSGDLAEHVAQRATRNLVAEMPAKVRGLIGEMGEVASTMWKLAADCYAESTPRAERLDRLDDRLDDLHVELTAEIAAGAVSVPVAIELALVGRFYERLGDHAVNVTRRIPASLRPKELG